ncbi:peptidase M28 [Phyllosticta citricarpa]|uniref:Peptide hydrolase n=2 Tax=Phyllosticta TaxID=121621 RepID=A0ABR1MF64_9PEZI
MRLFSQLVRATTLVLPSLSSSAAYTTLSDATLRRLPSPGDDFNIRTGRLLAPILIPRVPGTPGSEKVRQHFLDFFAQILPTWRVELHNSSSTTPTSNGKEVPFVNIIATRDPPWAKEGEVGRLALVAHYDSKLTPEGFIGATDSAAPCAMIMHAARSIDDALTRKWEKMEAEGAGQGFMDIEEETGVQILLLDGEEAFHSWSDSDSLYGARALAEDWENQHHPATSTFQTALSSIQLFLLLDLLGSANPTVPSYFQTTHWAYLKMADVEKRLRGLGQFKSSPNYGKATDSNTKLGGVLSLSEPMFLPDTGNDVGSMMAMMVQDDHIPFMARGVEVLHMIPSPFPQQWHTAQDDGDHLDINVVEDWAKLVTAFTAEWMDLEGFFDTKTSKGEEAQVREDVRTKRDWSRKDELH